MQIFLFKYLQGPFIDGFYNNFYETSSSNLPDPTSYILNENRILGVPRLRQMRVKIKKKIHNN